MKSAKNTINLQNLPKKNDAKSCVDQVFPKLCLENDWTIKVAPDFLFGHPKCHFGAKMAPFGIPAYLLVTWNIQFLCIFIPIAHLIYAMCGPLTEVLGWTLNKAKQLQLFKVVPHLKIAAVFSIGNKRHVQGSEQSTCDVQILRGKYW